MADKKISELTTASEIKNGDNLELSQDTGSGLVSLKATILAIANKILNGINFTSDLQTTEKTVIGAINEVAQGGGGGGSSTLDGLNDVDIDDTTLADGQALVYNGIEEKWVNGQGGGGTGGHTIIDENGNSMTARAGLQFVGANVEDDATNNRTIVDLASAGGIDGVFIDTDNVIQSATAIPNGTTTYTATEDCVVTYQLVATESGCNIQINDNIVDGLLTGSNYNVVSGNAYLKKGQIIKFVQTSTDAGTYTVYGIQTGTTHSKFQPVIYSLEEREIGVWTDGKPLYEKTVNFGSIPNNTSKNVAHNISNLDKVVSFDGVMFSSDSFETVPSGENSNFRLLVNDTNVRITTSANWNDWSDSYITIRYTKKTNVAGSGSWTPQGVPTHHYSLDEHIIGTWIDGSTLYEKTFDLASDLVVPYNSWVSLGITLDANKIIETKTTATVGSFQGNILMYNDNGTWKGTSPRNNDGSYVRYLTVQYTKSS